MAEPTYISKAQAVEYLDTNDQDILNKFLNILESLRHKSEAIKVEDIEGNPFEGDSSQTFKVADPTEDNHAINKKILTEALEALDLNGVSVVKKEASGTEGDANFWTKVATINLGAQTYADATLTLILQSANARLDSAIVSFAVRQNNVEIEEMFISIMSLTSTGNFTFFSEDGFAMIKNGFGNDVEIWVKKNNKHGKLQVREIARVTSYNGVSINYDASNSYINKSFEGLSYIVSGGLKFANKSIALDDELKSVDILDFNDPALEKNIKESNDGFRLTNLHERWTGESIILARTTTDYDGNTIDSENENEIDFKFHFKYNGYYYRRLFKRRTVDLLSIGGGQGLDDTLIIEKALKFNNVLIPHNTIANVRDLRIKEGQHIFSMGESGILRFLPSGNDANDSTTYTVVSEGKFSSITNIRIDGANNIGNGLLVKQDDGYKRYLNRVKIDNFKAYRASLDGGSFGVQGDKSKDDIRNGIGGRLMQIGLELEGNAAWELVATNIILANSEGEPLTIKRMTDSILQNLIIGNSCKRGVVNDFGIRNNKFQNFKVYRTSVLNLTGGFEASIGKIIPLNDTDGSVADVAFNFVGENNVFDNIEIQENGSNGASVGSGIYALKDSSITNLLIDGNGGIDTSENSTINGNYRRNGLLLYAYNKVKIQGIINDFRTKVNTCRQDKAIITLTEQVITTLATLERGATYRIKTVGSGGSFAAIQSDQLATKSDAVGFEFTLSLDYDTELADIAASLGTGWELYLVNSYAEIDVMMSNQYDQLQGYTGYDLTNIGTNSIVKINNTVI